MVAVAKKHAPVLGGGWTRERFKVGEQRDTVLGEVCPTAYKRFPWYFKLPHDDPIALLRWRRYARQRCITDLKFRAAVWEACRQDFLFWATTFGWIFEPRPLPRRLPFHPLDSQISLAAWIEETFGVRSCAINKTRGIGLSWLVSMFAMWKWLFVGDVAMAFLSKDEDTLDKAEGSNSLMGKLQYIYDNLPKWARDANPLKRTSEKKQFVNLRNGAFVQGFVSTGQKLRGLRFTWMFPDEFAFYTKASQEEWMTAALGTCNSVCIGSTWNDYDDMFHTIMSDGKSELLRLTAFWWNEKTRWAGAYYMQNDTPVFVDTEYDWTRYPDYDFGEPDLLDAGELRSPWVDGELRQPVVDKIKTLRDLYGERVAERTNSFFGKDVREALHATITSRPTPNLEGNLLVTGKRVEVTPTKKSNIRFWFDLETIRRSGPLTCFCDLADGAGLHYSVACFLDRYGRQVIEYGTNTVDIPNFTYNVIALCRWLGGDEGDGFVLLDAEANGNFIRNFRTEAERLEYGNLWRQKYADEKQRRKMIRAGEPDEYIGTRNIDGGMANCNELGRAIMALECKIYSPLVAEDIKKCSRNEEKGGQPKWPKSAHLGHGDYVQAAAGAWWRLRTSVVPQTNENESMDSRVQYIETTYPWNTDNRRLWSAQYA